MTHKPLPFSGAEHLVEIPRLPDETLHEYLVRSQRVLADRVRMVARARDAAEHILFMERARWRQEKIILILAGPLMGASAYVGLARPGIIDTAPMAFCAAVIAFAGITGGPFVLGFAALGERLSTWLVSHRSRRAARGDRRVR